MTKTSPLIIASLFCLVTSFMLEGAAAQTKLRASHQWPGDSGDIRHEMVQVMADALRASDTGLELEIYPASALYRPRQQWQAMVDGDLDISAFPLDYASGSHPEFSVTLMPGLVRNYERAERLNDSAFLDRIKEIAEQAGVVVLADAWLSGAFASTATRPCIRGPETVEGAVMRAAGPTFEQMLFGAGAAVTSMPSSKLYRAFETGVLDAGNTSSESFVSYNLQEQVSCLTAPGRNALWFMYEPILMSKASWDALSEGQQTALAAAAREAEDYFLSAARQSDQALTETFRRNGVEVIEMTDADFQAWLDVARETSYRFFARYVQGGDQLLKLALDVE